MEKLFSKIEGPMMKIGDKINNILFFQVLRDAFLLAFPVIIFGSIIIIIANFPLLYLFMDEHQIANWTNMLNPASLASVNIMSIFIALGIGYYYAKAKDVDPIFCGVVCVAGFFILFPWTTTSALSGGEEAQVYAGISNMGAKGMFVAIFMSLLLSVVYTFFMKKNLQIKMPEQVPPAVSRSFAALIPASIALLLALLIQIAFSFSPWDDVFDFVYWSVQAPLVNLGDGLAASIIAIFCAQFFWFFGLQGTSLVNSMMDPIYNTLMLENYSNYSQGLPVEHICTKPFFEVFTIGLGGSGCTLIVVIMIIAICRSKQLKSIARVALPASIFNVNEPIIFGMPIIFNPLVVIPWILAPMVSVTVAYLAMAWGLVPMTTGVSIPWTLPIFLNGMIATNSIAGAVLQAVQVVVVGVIWAPFIIILDRRVFKAEKEAIEAEKAKKAEEAKAAEEDKAKSAKVAEEEKPKLDTEPKPKADTSVKFKSEKKEKAKVKKG